MSAPRQSSTFLAVALALASCNPPPASVPSGSAPLAAPAFEPPACGCLRGRRKERTHAIASCGVEPIDLDVNGYCGTFTVLGRTVDTVTKARATIETIWVVPEYRLPTMLAWSPQRWGRVHEYVRGPHLAEVAEQGAELRLAPMDPDIAIVSPRVAFKVHQAASSVLMAVVGWPGKAVVAGRLVPDEESPLLQAAVVRCVDLQLHGWTTSVTASVRYRGTRHEGAADTLVFDVSVWAGSGNGDEHVEWTSQAQATGEVLLRAGDGAFLGMKLSGSMSDAESERAHRQEPKTCNVGTWALDLGWDTKCGVNR